MGEKCCKSIKTRYFNHKNDEMNESHCTVSEDDEYIIQEKAIQKFAFGNSKSFNFNDSFSNSEYEEGGFENSKSQLDVLLTLTRNMKGKSYNVRLNFLGIH